VVHVAASEGLGDVCAGHGGGLYKLNPVQHVARKRLAGFNPWNLKCDILASKFAFPNFNLCRYVAVTDVEVDATAVGGGVHKAARFALTVGAVQVEYSLPIA
jgi:hypothetical protein